MKKKVLILASAETKFLSTRIAESLGKNDFEVIAFLKHKPYEWHIKGKNFILRGAGMTKYAYFYMLIKTAHIKPDIIHVFDEKMIPHALFSKYIFGSSAIIHFPYKKPFLISSIFSYLSDFVIYSFNKKNTSFIGDFPKLFKNFSSKSLFEYLELSRAKKKIILQFSTPGTDNTLFLKTAETLGYNPQLHFVILYMKGNINIPNKKNITAIDISDFSEEKLIDWLKDASLGLIPETDNSFSPDSMYRLFCMASLPVLSSNKEVTYLIKEHSTGKIFDTNDRFELSKLILSTIYDHYNYPKIRMNCRKTAEKYCWEVSEKDLLDIYRGL